MPSCLQLDKIFLSQLDKSIFQMLVRDYINGNVLTEIFKLFVFDCQIIIGCIDNFLHIQ